MLPGKRYTPDDVLAILRRKFWIILVPFAAVSASTALYVRQLPDLYRSEAIIQVKPPQLPVNLLRTSSSNNDRVADRLPAIRERLISRTTLEGVVNDLNLYPAERQAGIMEDIIDRMRGALTVAVVRGDSFRVTFTDRNPRTAMRVAERLATIVINESAQDRTRLLEGTGDFLESQLADARARLVEHERKVEEYQRRFAGELPTQVNANLQAVQNHQAQLQVLTTTINRDQERRLLLERQLVDLSNAVDPGTGMTVGAGSATAQQLTAARAELAQLQLRLKADHPDVQTMRRTIRDLEAKLESEVLEVPLSSESGLAVSPAEQKRQRDMADLRAQIEQIDKAVAQNQAEVQRIRGLADTYLKRAEAGPTRETEMIELNRDYNTLQGVYANLLAKKEEANLAASIESREMGMQFNLLDPARLPQRPFSPDRTALNSIGMAVGLAIGIVFIGLQEFRTVTFQTDEEVNTVLAVPVLAVVPIMESPPERRRKQRVRLFWNLLMGGTVAGCLGLLLYTFVR